MAKLLSGTRIYGTATVDTQLFVSGTTESSSTITGALQIVGGLGVGKGAFFGGVVTATSFVGTVLGVASSATNLVGGSTGAIVYQSNTNTTAFLSLSTAGYVLIAGASGPQWTKILPVTNGGTGVETITGVVYGNGTSAFTTATGVQISTALGSTNIAGFAANVTGIVATNNGGTGISSWTAGDIAYYSSGTALTKVGIGSTNYILGSDGSKPLWISPSGVAAGSASTSSNLAGGTSGQVPYQTAAGLTSFYGPGTAGQILLSSGTNAPVYTSTSSIYVGRAVLADTATLANLATTATFANTATTATNIAGGTSGQLAYQTAPGQTSFVSTGTAGDLLISNGTSAPTYNNTLTLTSITSATSTASGALQVRGGVGIGGALYVGTASYINNSRILIASDLETVTTTATYITNDPTSQVGLAAIANTTTVYGTYNFGTVSDIATINDYNTGTNTGFYSINDAATAPAYVVYIGFSNVTTFTRLVLNVNYTQGSGHTVEIGLYNYITLTWDTFTTYSGSTNWFQFILGVIDSVPYISSGKVNARLYHVSFGNTAHRTWIDYAVLEDSIQGGQGPRGATGAIGATGPQGLTTTTTSTFIFSNSTNSTSTNSGAVVVYGGVGINQDVNIGGNLTVLGTVNATIVGSVTTATNLAGGTAGQVPYQTAPGLTSFYGPGTAGNILVSNGTGAPTYNNTLTLTSTNASTSTTTGALQVAGGVGVGGNIYGAGRIWLGDSTVSYSYLTTATSGAFAARSINLIDTQATIKIARIHDSNSPAIEFYAINTNTAVRARWDWAVSTTAGQDNAAIRWLTSGLSSNTGADRIQFYSNTSSVIVNIPSTMVSTGTSSGALAVAGGVGIGGSLFVNFTATILSSVASSSTATGALQVLGGIGAGGAVYSGGVVASQGASYQTSLSSTGSGPMIQFGSPATPNLYMTLGAYSGANNLDSNTRDFNISFSTGFGANAVAINATTGVVTLASTSAATSTATGALRVLGGVGIGGALYAGGSIYSSATIYSNNLLLQGDNSNAYVRPINAGSYLYLGAANSNYLSIGPAGVVTVLATTAASATNTGALQVLGGLGVGGDIYANTFNTLNDTAGTVLATFGGSSLVNRWIRIRNDASAGVEFGQRDGTFTLPGASLGGGVALLKAGNNKGFAINVNDGTGFATISNAAFWIDNTGVTKVTATTTATSTATGAFQVAGGVGIGGNLYVGGEIVASKLTIQLTTITTTQVTTDDIISTYNSTNATNTASGALQITGGAGIGRDLYVGGTIFGTFSGTVAGTVSTATNIAGGTAGQLVYQTGPSATSFAGPGTAGNVLVSNGTGAPTYNNTLTLAGTTVSTSTTTGALVVTGGVGIGRNLFVETSATISTNSGGPGTGLRINKVDLFAFAASGSNAGEPTFRTSISSATTVFRVMPNNTATNGIGAQFEFFASDYFTTPSGWHNFRIVASTSSFIIDTAKDLAGDQPRPIIFNLGGQGVATNTATYANVLTLTTSGVGINTLTPGAQFGVEGTVRIAGTATITTTTNSISTTTGALIVTGGVGVGNNLVVGNTGTFGISSSSYITVSGANSGSGPIIASQGSDSNIDLNLTTKGTSGVRFNVGNGSKYTYLSSDSANNFQLVGAANTANLGIYATGGGSIRFYTAAGLLEEQLRITQTASAVNFIQVTGATTGNDSTISAQGSDANTGLIFLTKGSTGLTFRTRGGGTARNAFVMVDNGTASVNYIQAQSNTTGNGPVLSALGSDTNIDLNLTTKGTGAVNLNTSNGTQFRVADTFAGGTATNYFQVQGRATFQPLMSTAGASTDISMQFSTKGTGSVSFWTNNAAQQQFNISHTASAVNYAQITGATTSSGPTLSVQGTDSNVDLNITTKGTGSVKFNTGATPALQVQIVDVAGANRYLQLSGGVSGSSSPSIGAIGGTTFNLYATGSSSIDFWSNGLGVNRQLSIAHTASAVNYVQVTGSATGNQVMISSQGSDSNISLGFTAKLAGNTNFFAGGGFLQFQVGATASAVNYIQVAGNTAGQQPYFLSAGSDTNVGITYATKGTGSHFFSSGGGVYYQFNILNTNSAVNYLQVTGAAAGGNPSISSQGSDTNVPFDVITKGTGFIRLRPNSTEAFRIFHTTNTVNRMQVTGAASGNAPAFSVEGSDTDIDLNLTAKGSGKVLVTTSNTATSTATGALVVYGGVGINKDLYVGGTIYGTFSGAVVGTASTATSLAGGGPGMVPYQSNTNVTAFVATGTAGTILVSNGTSAPSWNNTLSLAGTTASTSTTTGALTVVGGVGVGNNLVVGGYGQFAGPFNESTTTLGVYVGYLNSNPRIGFFNGTASQNWQIDNNSGTFRWYTPGVTRMQLDANGILTILTSTNATSTTTGALIVNGGIGVGNSIFVNNTATIGANSSGALYVGTTGGDYGRNLVGSFRRDQNGITDFAVINSTAGASAAVRISKIGGTANNFVDWFLSDNSGASFDSFNYGSAVQFTRITYNGSEQARFTFVNTAVNYLSFSAGTAGNATIITATGSDTNVFAQYRTKGTGAHDFYTNNNLQFRVADSGGTSTNYVQVYGNVSGSRPIIGPQGSDTNIGLNIETKGTGALFFKTGGSSIAQLTVANVNSSVNYLQVAGAITGSAPTITVLSTADTNVDLNIITRGSGKVNLTDGQGTGSLASPLKLVLPVQYASSAGVGPNKIDLYNNQYGLGVSGANLEIYGGGGSGDQTTFYNSGAAQFRIVGTSTATNYVQVTGGVSGSAVQISAQGSDSNVFLQFYSKGTSGFNFFSGAGTNRQLRIEGSVSSVNYLDIWGGAAGASPSLRVAGSNTDIDLTLIPKGNGRVLVTTSNTATSTSTGALVVYGGVGINRDLFVGNTATILSTAFSTSTVEHNALYVAGGVGIGRSLFVTGPAIFNNSVVFAGTSTYVYSTNTVYTDNLINLHVPVGSTGTNHDWTVDDGQDIGFVFHYYKGTDRNAFLGFDNTTTSLEWFSNGNEVGGVFTGTEWGVFRTGAIVLNSLTNATSTATGALQVLGGVGIGRDVWIGGNLNVAGTINATISGVITTATNIGSGTAGQVPYQTGVGATSFFGPGTAGQILLSSGTNAPVYTSTASIHIGRSTLAETVASVSQSTPATYYPLFVDSNNATAAGEQLYTTSSIVINPAGGGQLGLGTTPVSSSALTISRTYSTATAAESFPFYIAGVYNIADTNLKQVIRTNYSGQHTTGTQAFGVNILALASVGGVGGVTTNLYNYWSRIDNSTNATVTNAFHHFVSDGGGSGGPVNQYGYYADPLTKGTQNFAFYAAGTTKSYFGGDVGIGVTAPTAKLDVSGGVRISGVTTVTNTTTATSSTTGALQVVGGIGVSGSSIIDKLFVGANTPTGFDNFTPAPLNAVVTASGVAPVLNLINYFGGGGRGPAVDFYTYTNIASAPANARIAAVDDAAFSANIIFSTKTPGSATNPLAERMRINSAGTVVISNTTNATSTTTGALQVSGGVGVGGDIWAGNIVTGPNQYIYFGGTTGTRIFRDGGQNGMSLQTSNISRLFIADTNGAVTITSTATSTSTTTGALIVTGGVGVAGGMVVGNTITGTNMQLSSTLLMTSAVNTQIVLNNGGPFYGTIGTIPYGSAGLQIWSLGWGNSSGAPTGHSLQWTNSGTVLIPNTSVWTSSTSTNTGALVVTGGVGIGGNLNVGGPITANNGIIRPNERSMFNNMANGLVWRRYSHAFAGYPNSPDEFTTIIKNSSTFVSQGITANINNFTLSAENYITEFAGYIYAATTGTYAFGVSSDDASDLFIDDTLVAHHYGAHGAVIPFGGTTSTVVLQRGYHRLYTRFFELSGGDSHQILYIPPTTTTWTVIESTNLYINPSDFLRSNGTTLDINSTATISNTTVASSTATGALVVTGGVGIGGDLRVGGTIFGAFAGTVSGTSTNASNIATIAVNTNSSYFPTFVDSNNASTSFEALYTTSSFSINPTTGAVTIGAGGFGAARLSLGALVSNRVLSIYDDNTNWYGLGIAGSEFRNLAPQNWTVGTYTRSSDTYTERMRVDSSGNVSIGIASASSLLHVAGTARITGVTTVTNVTNATSTATGALQVLGGVGIGGNIYVGGSIYELTSGTAYQVVSQADIGSAPNQIPLNQYLGKLAFQDYISGGTF